MGIADHMYEAKGQPVQSISSPSMVYLLQENQNLDIRV